MEGVEFTITFFYQKMEGLVKSESLQTLQVLGLSNITSPQTFAKSTTAKTVLR